MKSWKKKFLDNSASRRDAAMKIWEQTQPIDGTLGDLYLQSRGITIDLPASIRFIADLKHWPTGLTFPAMVASVMDAKGKFCSIHRTFLNPDGINLASTWPKWMLFGPVSGGTIRLAEADDPIALVEGLEDGLFVQQMTGLVTCVYLGTSGLKNLAPILRD